MELLPQDIFNGIVIRLNRRAMINLSCTSWTVNGFFDSEMLWRGLVEKHYPKCELDGTWSWYEKYVKEFRNRNIGMYVGVSYWTEHDDEKDRSERFTTCDEAFEWLWDKCFFQQGMLKQYYQLKPRLRRLEEAYGHRFILWVCKLEDPAMRLDRFIKTNLTQFLYDEDVSEEECLDLMEDYMDEVCRYKEVLRGVFSFETKSQLSLEITRKTGDCGWYIYRIERVKGVREYSDDENGDNGEVISAYQKWRKLNTKWPYDVRGMIEAIEFDRGCGSDSTEFLPR